jgi:hypothetical protein
MNDTPPRTDQDVPRDPAAVSSLHVLPDRVGGWRVEREGDDTPLSEHNSETAAEGAAVNEARVTGTLEIVIHDRYDRVYRAEH